MPNLNTLTALVIDDSAVARQSVRETAMKLGFEVVDTSTNYFDGLAKLAGGSYDLILCDYFLGDGRNGHDLLSEALDRGLIEDKTPFLIISAERSVAAVLAAADCGTDDYILKPFTAQQLKDRVDRAIAKKGLLLSVQRLASKTEVPINKLNAALNSNQLARHKDAVLRVACQTLVGLGEHERAKQLLQANKLNSPWVSLCSAKIELLQGKTESCIARLKTLVAQTPRYLQALDTLTDIYENIGEAALAEDSLRQAQLINPRNSQRASRLAQVLIAQQKTEEALEILAKAGKPSDQQLTQRLILLDLLARKDLTQAQALLAKLTPSLWSSGAQALLHSIGGTPHQSLESAAAAQGTLKHQPTVDPEAYVLFAIAIAIDGNTENSVLQFTRIIRGLTGQSSDYQKIKMLARKFSVEQCLSEAQQRYATQRQEENSRLRNLIDAQLHADATLEILELLAQAPLGQPRLLQLSQQSVALVRAPAGDLTHTHKKAIVAALKTKLAESRPNPVLLPQILANIQLFLNTVDTQAASA